MGLSGGTKRANGIGGKEEKSSGNSFGGFITVGVSGDGEETTGYLVPGKFFATVKSQQ